MNPVKLANVNNPNSKNHNFYWWEKGDWLVCTLPYSSSFPQCHCVGCWLTPQHTFKYTNPTSRYPKCIEKDLTSSRIQKVVRQGLR